MTGSAQQQIADIIREKRRVSTLELVAMTGRDRGDIAGICRSLMKWGQVVKTYETGITASGCMRKLVFWHWVGESV